MNRDLEEQIKIIKVISSCNTVDQVNTAADWLITIGRYNIITYQDLLVKRLNVLRKKYATANQIQEVENEQGRPFYKGAIINPYTPLQPAENIVPIIPNPSHQHPQSYSIPTF